MDMTKFKFSASSIVVPLIFVNDAQFSWMVHSPTCVEGPATSLISPVTRI